MNWNCSRHASSAVDLAAVDHGRGILRELPTCLGSCEVFAASRVLRRRGTIVDLGSKAFDLLLALIGGEGHAVSKDEIMRRVWPTTTVIEANLRVQISALRRALGADRWRLKTISGRGYLIITDAPISRPAAAPAEWTRRRPSAGAASAAFVALIAPRLFGIPPYRAEDRIRIRYG